MKEAGDRVGRFRIERLLGEGGIANVYQVRHELLGTVHALKLLPVNKRSLAKRLIQEGRIQAHLRHPNVVAVTDVVEEDGQIGLVMEFIEGFSLEECLREGGAMGRAEAMDLFSQILSGVSAAHQAGVLHRDLKPANVLLTADHNRVLAKVADFGIAKLVSQEESLRKTMVGTPLGTPGYMAPEQISDSAQADARSDIFALGAILYEMLSGRRTFGGRDLRRILNDTSEGNYTPLSVRVPECPKAIDRAVAKALEVDPRRRFQSCMEMAVALGIDTHIVPLRGLPTGVDERLATAGPGLNPTQAEIDHEEADVDDLASVDPDGPAFNTLSPRARVLPPLPEEDMVEVAELEDLPSEEIRRPTLMPPMDFEGSEPTTDEPTPLSESAIEEVPVVDDIGATMHDNNRPWGRSSDAIDTWAPDETDEEFELRGAEDAAIAPAPRKEPERAPWRPQQGQVRSIRNLAEEVEPAAQQQASAPTVVGRRPPITEAIAASLGDPGAGPDAPRPEPPPPTGPPLSDRLRAIGRYAMVALVPLAFVAVLGAVGGQIGARTMEDLQAATVRARVSWDESLAGQDALVGEIVALGGDRELLSRRQRAFHEAATSPEKLETGKALTEMMLRQLSAAPASGNSEAVQQRREMERRIQELQQRQRAYENALQNWHSGHNSALGTLAVALGMAEAPSAGP